jgi:capsular polysaccharide biosynthesis protein
MSGSRDKQDFDGELDLGDILRELFRWKWIILLVVLLAALLTAAYSLTKPNIYEASAALIVREPPRAIERDADEPKSDDIPTLSVETLQLLTNSTELVWTLFENLVADGVITSGEGEGKQVAFRYFQESVFTETKKQQGRSAANSELLNILVLRARAQSPEQAELIANKWAELAVEKSSEIYTTGVAALDAYIGGIYTQSNDSLIKAEEALATEIQEASVELKQARLTTLSEKITELEGVIFDIDIELEVNAVAITEGEKRILEQRFEDEWIGTVAEDALLKNEPYPFEQDKLSGQSLKVLDLIQQKVKQTESLRVFRREQNLLGKEKKFAHYQLDMERILSEKAQVEDELPSVEAALKALRAELESIPEKITLNKAITDDALWNLHVNGSDSASKTETPLKSESLNPLHQSTRRSMIELLAKTETLRGSLVQLEQTEKNVTASAEELESEIDTIREELERRQTALEATKTSIALLRDDFLEETKLVEELLLDNLRRIAERKMRDEQREEFTGDAEKLTTEISKNELAIGALTREVENSKNVRTALASKAEEVELIKVSVENAAQTGTSVFYPAQASANKVAPSRSKMVLLAMIVALAACSAIAIASKLLRESEDSH